MRKNYFFIGVPFFLNNNEISKNMDDIVANLTASEPADRVQSAEALLSLLSTSASSIGKADRS